jgi:hypothetical protein
VEFLSRGPGYTLFLTGNEALVSLRKSEVRSQNWKDVRGPWLVVSCRKRPRGFVTHHLSAHPRHYCFQRHGPSPRPFLSSA